MRNLPVGWTQCKVGELFYSFSGGTPSKSKPEYWGGVIPWISSGEFNSDVINQGTEFISGAGLENSSAKLCRPGSVLVVVRSGILKHTLPVALVGSELAINQDIKSFDSGDDDLNRWLFLSLKNSAKEILSLNREGTTVQSVKYDTLKEHELAIPPLNEQRRIVAKLEKLLNRVDAAQERLATISRTLKRFRQSILQAACSGRLTADWRLNHNQCESAATLLERIRSHGRTVRQLNAEGASNGNLPDSWLAVRIHELTSMQNGRAFPSKQYGSAGVRLLRPGNLSVNGRVEWNQKNTACLPIEWGSRYPEFLLGDGELLMNLTAQSLKDEFLGRVCIKTDSVPALLNQRIARFVNNGPDDLRPYLFVYFKSPQFRSYVNTLDNGSLIRHMHSKQVLSHIAPLPPIEEQQEIVRRVEALFKTADALEARYLKAKAHVDKLTQSILAKAFRGELVSQDPHDEPASVLLERICQERK